MTMTEDRINQQSKPLERGAKLPLYVAIAIARDNGQTFVYSVIERRHSRNSVIEVTEVWQTIAAEPVAA
jgi:hypothetical protein